MYIQIYIHIYIDSCIQIHCLTKRADAPAQNVNAPNTAFAYLYSEEKMISCILVEFEKRIFS